MQPWMRLLANLVDSPICNTRIYEFKNIKIFVLAKTKARLAFTKVAQCQCQGSLTTKEWNFLCASMPDNMSASIKNRAIISPALRGFLENSYSHKNMAKVI